MKNIKFKCDPKILFQWVTNSHLRLRSSVRILGCIKIKKKYLKYNREKKFCKTGNFNSGTKLDLFYSLKTPYALNFIKQEQTYNLRNKYKYISNSSKKLEPLLRILFSEYDPRSGLPGLSLLCWWLQRHDGSWKCPFYKK